MIKIYLCLITSINKMSCASSLVLSFTDSLIVRKNFSDPDTFLQLLESTLPSTQPPNILTHASNFSIALANGETISFHESIGIENVMISTNPNTEHISPWGDTSHHA
jgi:hypothetical protein